MSNMVFDAVLHSRADLDSRGMTGTACTWDKILIGNGASCAIWRDFSYRSIYLHAKDHNRLSRSAVNLFEQGRTENFENVFHDLLTASKVIRALGRDCIEVDDLYSHIKEALAVSIKDVHIPWGKARSVLEDIYEALTRYKVVFTTNYDLLFYWAINEHGPSLFKDYFWSEGNTFDLRDVDIRDDCKVLLYLHGGLHLEELPSGSVHKGTNEGRTLLEQFGRSNGAESLPLIVTEGSAENKMKSILNSSYLSFALGKLAGYKDDLVIFGHSLGALDKHLLETIKNYRHLAISVFPATATQIKETKARYFEKFPDADIYFFDATTHPLGNPGLLVSP